MKNKAADLAYGDLTQDQYVTIRVRTYYMLMKDKLESLESIEILDIGGYTGDLLDLIRAEDPVNSKKIKYSIIDFDTSAIEIAKQKGIDARFMDFNLGDSREVFNKKFDVIVCTEVLEHVVDPSFHLESFKDLLKPDGICIISLPDENTIFHRIYSVLGYGIDACAFAEYTTHKHLHFPTISQSGMFVTSQFKIEKETYYINPGGKGSKFSGFGSLFTSIPDSFWYGLANHLPSLFARGGVWRLVHK